MKGLLIKDGKLLLIQGKLFLGIAALLMIGSWMQGDDFPQYATIYSIMMMSIFVISTLNYDEYDNGMKYLLALPVERRTYVREKYLFGALTAGTAWGVCSLLGMAGSLFRHADGLGDYLISGLGVALVAVLLLSISFPLLLHFGAEKGRGIYMGIMIGMFCVIASFFQFGWNVSLMGQEPIRQALSVVSSHSLIFAILGVAVYLGILTISYQCAVKAMERREF